MTEKLPNDREQITDNKIGHEAVWAVPAPQENIEPLSEEERNNGRKFRKYP
ncbi:MAG TPA: hypothetical protein VK978_02900 [Candidatus Saccharimonadales bacterium]|nr:hypothetical protein [Candidatus Saccharimonadales bacterium]